MILHKVECIPPCVKYNIYVDLFLWNKALPALSIDSRRNFVFVVLSEDCKNEYTWIWCSKNTKSYFQCFHKLVIVSKGHNLEYTISLLYYNSFNTNIVTVHFILLWILAAIFQSCDILSGTSFTYWLFGILVQTLSRLVVLDFFQSS